MAGNEEGIMDSEPASFTTRLRAAIAGRAHDRVADAAGISRRHLRRMLSGAVGPAGPTVLVVASLAKALEVDPGELAFGAHRG